MADREQVVTELQALLARNGLAGALKPLPGEHDLNFRLQSDTGEYLVKLHAAGGDPALLDMQIAVLDHLAQTAPDLPLSRPLALDGAPITPCAGYQARLLSWLPGQVWARASRTADSAAGLGRLLGRLDRALESFHHPAAARPYGWDIAQAAQHIPSLPVIEPPEKRAAVQAIFADFTARIAPVLAGLPRQVIHNDANDYNVLLDDSGQVTGLLDFGDMVTSARVVELAVASAYALIGAEDPVGTIMPLIAAYHAENPLSEAEVELIFGLIRLRYAVSITMAAVQIKANPENTYLLVSQQDVWRELQRLNALNPAMATLRLRAACGMDPAPTPGVPTRSPAELVAARAHLIGRSLSTAYAPHPLKIVGGEGCYLIDHEGTRWLDMVNNVAHVGHNHPRVVAAAQTQMARLNTNSRYLHDNLVEYAERLTALFPDPLSVCFFVNSGSEANDLAIRLARAATGHHDLITVDHAYHGHVSSLIDVSPYKFAGRGGQGRPAHVRVAELPDPYRGRFRYGDPDAGSGYAQSVADQVASLAAEGRRPALFFSEGVLGTGGQIVPPPGYLAAAYAHVRAAGGLCLADEVQVGFGRVGSHMWAFQTQGVTPDIVTLGKPIGNGHPMAAVITTPAIAAAFANGMEYFNTFGGNPVSASIGLAVLDVIRDEGLMDHCARLGAQLMDGARALAERHAAIGDVRGLGLFNGIELVTDRATQAPAAGLLDRVIARMKQDHHILLSSEGPLHNVLKIKPPAAFSKADCERFLTALDQSLTAG